MSSRTPLFYRVWKPRPLSFSLSLSLCCRKIPFCTHGKSPMHTVRKVLAAFDLPLLFWFLRVLSFFYAKGSKRIACIPVHIPLGRVTGIMHSKRRRERGNSERRHDDGARKSSGWERDRRKARKQEGKERNQTSSWDVNSRACSPPARYRYFVLTRVPLSTRCTHMHQTVDRKRRAEGEAHNSVHSEAFEREVCSACTLHSRAVHNSYCPSTRCTADSARFLPQLSPSPQIDASHRSHARITCAFESATRMHSTHTQIMHGHLFRR